MSRIEMLMGRMLHSSKKRMPDWAKVCGLLQFLPGVVSPRSLLHAATDAFLHLVLKDIGAKCLSRERVDLPIRGINIYQHKFLVGDVEFSCTEASDGLGNASVSAVTNCIFERDVRSGCQNCGFGENLEDDEQCSICKGSFLRSFLKSKGMPVFRESGWVALSRLVGDEYADILDDISTFNGKFQIDREFRERLVHELVESDDSWLGEADSELKAFLDL